MCVLTLDSKGLNFICDKTSIKCVPEELRSLKSYVNNYCLCGSSTVTWYSLTRGGEGGGEGVGGRRY